MAAPIKTWSRTSADSNHIGAPITELSTHGLQEKGLGEGGRGRGRAGGRGAGGEGEPGAGGRGQRGRKVKRDGEEENGGGGGGEGRGGEMEGRERTRERTRKVYFPWIFTVHTAKMLITHDSFMIFLRPGNKSSNHKQSLIHRSRHTPLDV